MYGMHIIIIIIITCTAWKDAWVSPLWQRQYKLGTFEHIRALVGTAEAGRFSREGLVVNKGSQPPQMPTSSS